MTNNFLYDSLTVEMVQGIEQRDNRAQVVAECVRNAAKASVVFIWTDMVSRTMRFGNGVHIGEGVILTAKHCVPEEKGRYLIQVIDSMGHFRFNPKIDPLFSGNSDDVAGLRLSDYTDLPSVPVSGQKLKINKPVYLVGRYIDTGKSICIMSRILRNRHFLEKMQQNWICFGDGKNIVNIQADQLLVREGLSGSGVYQFPEGLVGILCELGIARFSVGKQFKDILFSAAKRLV